MVSWMGLSIIMISLHAKVNSDCDIYLDGELMVNRNPSERLFFNFHTELRTRETLNLTFIIDKSSVINSNWNLDRTKIWLNSNHFATERALICYRASTEVCSVQRNYTAEDLIYGVKQISVNITASEQPVCILSLMLQRFAQKPQLKGEFKGLSNDVYVLVPEFTPWLSNMKISDVRCGNHTLKEELGLFYANASHLSGHNSCDVTVKVGASNTVFQVDAPTISGNICLSGCPSSSSIPLIVSITFNIILSAIVILLLVLYIRSKRCTKKTFSPEKTVFKDVVQTVQHADKPVPDVTQPVQTPLTSSYSNLTSRFRPASLCSSIASGEESMHADGPIQPPIPNTSQNECSIAHPEESLANLAKPHDLDEAQQ